MSFGEVFPDFRQWVIGQPATQAVIKRKMSFSYAWPIVLIAACDVFYQIFAKGMPGGMDTSGRKLAVGGKRVVLEHRRSTSLMYGCMSA